MNSWSAHSRELPYFGYGEIILRAAILPHRLKPTPEKPVVAAVNRCATQNQTQIRMPPNPRCQLFRTALLRLSTMLVSIRQQLIFLCGLSLTLRAEVTAAAGQHDAPDRGPADQARLAFTAINSMLELEKSLFSIGVHVIGD
jgi:hypothetical protein